MRIVMALAIVAGTLVVFIEGLICAIVVVPLFAGPDAAAYAERVLGSKGLENGFALVERSSKFTSWAPWLAARGYRMRKVWSEGNPSAWIVERSP